MAKAVAEILGYRDPRKSIYDRLDVNDTLTFKDLEKYADNTPVKVQSHTLYINESGLTKLIFSSKMPKAEQFTDWIASEVLPSIRKYGSYTLNNKTHHKFQNLDQKAGADNSQDIVSMKHKYFKYKAKFWHFMQQNHVS